MRTGLIRIAGHVLAAAFAAVGLFFLIIPGRVVALFNRLSVPWGFPPAPGEEAALFVMLAAAYMTVVTALAWNMGRHPENPVYPRLLALAKIASSLLSLGFAIFRTMYFVVLLNGIVDGLIGHFVLWLTLPPRKEREASP